MLQGGLVVVKFVALLLGSAIRVHLPRVHLFSKNLLPLGCLLHQVTENHGWLKGVAPSLRDCVDGRSCIPLVSHWNCTVSHDLPLLTGALDVLCLLLAP